MWFPIKITKITLLFVGIVLLGCLDPYEPPVSSEEINFLVIDGSINSTDSMVTVKMSRAISLGATTEYPLETSADVWVEDENNQIIPLTEVEDGIYSAKHVFENTLQYRLKIATRGQVYLSDFIQLINSAPIDSVSWKADQTELELFANSHDFTEGFKYYRYLLEETYEYTAPFRSFYKLANGEAVFRLPTEDIYSCWTTQIPPTLTLASTENFSQNIISEVSIHKITRGDKRLWRKYSMLLRQQALSKEAYDYWKQLKKITESVGGLFDPIPYQITGNVKNTADPNEIVLGYFSGGAVTQKRVVIKSRDLPIAYSNALEHNCEEEYMPIGLIYTLTGQDVILTRAQLALTTVIGYWYTTPACADCRFQGGTNVRPDFMY